ncbi:MAG: glycerol-3-phosphate acyltransferase [Chloroflexia bacterium]
MVRDVLAVLIGYLLGSIPTAYLVARWRAGVHIRYVGEGNVGARNVWHVVGPFWGFLVGFLDILKGLAAVLLAWALGASLFGALLAGPAAIVGHAFPLFLRFQGGKGVSTTAGVLIAWSPWSSLLALVLFFLAQMILHDFNRSIVIGVAAGILLPLAFGKEWWLPIYAGLLFASLALKKWLDLAHERHVWATSGGWQGDARPGWYREETSPDFPETGEPEEMQEKERPCSC